MLYNKEAVHALIKFKMYTIFWSSVCRTSAGNLPSICVPLKDRMGKPFLLLFMQPQWGVTAVCLMSAFAAVDIQELLVRLVNCYALNIPHACVESA